MSEQPEPTAVRNTRKRGGKAHREQTMAEAVEMGALPHAVTGCSRWTRDMTEHVPLSTVPPADRCQVCWPNPNSKETK